LRILVEKILTISLKLNFSPNTLGCYGLNLRDRKELSRIYHFSFLLQALENQLKRGSPYSVEKMTFDWKGWTATLSESQ